MADLGTNDLQNKLIKQSRTSLTTIETYQKLLFNELDKQGQQGSPNAQGREAIKDLKKSLSLMFNVYTQICSNHDMQSYEQDETAFKSVKKEVLTKQASLYNVSLNTIVSIYGDTIAKKVKKTITNVGKSVTAYYTFKKANAYKPGLSKEGLLSYVQKKKKDTIGYIKNTIGIHEHEKIFSKETAARLGRLSLGGLGLAGAVFLKSPGTAFPGVQYLSYRRREDEKRKQTYLTGLNLIENANRQVKDKKKRNNIKNTFNAMAGGGSFISKRNTSVLLGDNPGGREHFSISGKTNLSGITKGPSLVNIKRGSRISANPLSGTGTTSVNSSDFSRFGGGTGDSRIISELAKHTVILTKMLQDNNIYHRDQINRAEDLENASRGFGKSGGSSTAMLGGGSNTLSASVLKALENAGGGSGGFISNIVGEIIGNYLGAKGLRGGFKILKKIPGITKAGNLLKKIPGVGKLLGGGVRSVPSSVWTDASMGTIPKVGRFAKYAKFLKGPGRLLGGGLGILGTGMYGMDAFKNFKSGNKLMGGYNALNAGMSAASMMPGHVGAVGKTWVGATLVGTALNSAINKGVEKLTGSKGETLGGFLYDFFHKQDALQDETEKTQKTFLERLREKIPFLGGGSYSAPYTHTTGTKAPVYNSAQAKKNEIELANYARKNGITDPKELAMFMAQTSQESGGFTSLTERGNSDYFRQYEGKNGNNRPGDGERYKGRGFIQLTGKYNYAEMSKRTGLDLVNNPELAAQPENAQRIAVEFWKWKKLQSSARKGDIVGNTRIINGGANGLSDREQRYNYYTQNGVPTTPSNVVQAKQEIDITKAEKKREKEKQQQYQEAFMKSVNKPNNTLINNTNVANGNNSKPHVNISSGDSSQLATYTQILGQT